MWARVMHMKSLLGLVILHGALAAPLAESVEKTAAESPVLQLAHWGAKLVRLRTGEVLYSRNENHHFTPASNTKLFSTALVLTRLGSAHRLETRLVGDGALASGVLRGDLRLVGGGDPTLSGRPIPYQYKAPFSRPLAPLEEMVEQAWRAGLRRVTGDVVGDDSAYIYEPFPDGWSVDDGLYSYGAPVSALILHDNAFTVRVEGGESAGSPARLWLDPPNGYFTLHNRVRTAAKGPHRIWMDRPGSGRMLEFWGALAPAAVRSLDAAVDDPARYAAFALREALQRRGIRVDGGFRARHRTASQLEWHEPNGPMTELAQRQSPPLAQLIQVTNKVSQNLWAEICLREAARRRGSTPSRQEGLEELKSFLAELGATRKDYRFEDGSGLSRLTLVTPALLTRLLEFMDRSPERAAWLESLPIGGEDGTLAYRFQGDARPRAVIRAKTGTLSHVTALAGYLEPANGDRLAFSILVNNAHAEASEVRKWVDKLVVIFAQGGV